MNCSPLMSSFPSACRRSGATTHKLGVLRVEGREGAERLLRRIYPSIKSGLCIITEILSGYDAILLGNITPPSTKEGESEKASPVIIYMDFNSEGEIRIMTIAAIDLQPLADQIRCAALNGALKAP
jgi:hypothetical protein